MQSPSSKASDSGWVSRLFAPVDNASIVLFRVCFGAILMWEVWRYFNGGHIKAWWIDPVFHATYLGFDWVKPWPGVGMYIHFAVLGVLAFAIMAGLFYRWAVILFFFGFSYIFLLDQAQYLNHFYLIGLLGFLLIFIPAHRAFSLDARLHPEIRANTVPAWALWLLRIQIGIPYFYGGLAKLNGDWLGGEPMRTWMADYAGTPLFGPLFTMEEVVYLFSYGGLILDLAIVPLLIWRRSRPYAYAFALFFHLMNAWLFHIGIFPWMMIVATTLFFEPEWPRKWLKKLGLPESKGAAMPEIRRPPTLPRRWVLALIGVYLAVQLPLPLRHWLYPGNIMWTGEGYHFAWHMKLNSYQGLVRFVVTDPVEKKQWVVDPREYLTERQYLAMPGRPGIIHQLSHFIAEDFRRKGHGRVEVRAEAEVSLNGRRPQWLIDPKVDLAAQPRSLKPASWFMPLVVPLEERIYHDELAVTRNTWSHFEEGAGIIIEERALGADGQLRKRRKKLVLSSIDNGRPNLTHFPEGAGYFDETGNTYPAPLGKIPEALYMDPAGTRKDGLKIDGLLYPCTVHTYEFDDPIQKWRGQLELWRSDQVLVPYRHLEAIGPLLSLAPDVLAVVFQIEMGDRRGIFKRQVLGLQELFTIAERAYLCVLEAGEAEIYQGGKKITTLSRRWLSSEIPGHVARLEREVDVDGVSHAEGMIVVEVNTGTESGPSPVEESLQKAIEAYYRGMHSEEKGEQVAAVQTMLPNRRDFSVLFPTQADKLWRILTPHLTNLIRNAPEIAEATKRTGQVQNIQTIDVRKHETSGQAKAIIELIPKDIPAYLVVTRRQNGSSWTGPYFFVNGRWIRIPGYENIPQYIAQAN